MGFESGEDDKFGKRMSFSPEQVRAIRKAAGLPEEVPVESEPTTEPQEQPREAERKTHFEEDANPTQFIDVSKLRERLSDEEAERKAEEQKALLEAIGKHIDDLMPDKEKK